MTAAGASIFYISSEIAGEPILLNVREERAHTEILAEHKNQETLQNLHIWVKR